MFWNLLLSHILGDYPLQPMWLVRSKANMWGLALHASIHYLTMLLLVGSARATVWAQILALALFHFLVDVAKYRLAIARPRWIVAPYFVDQAVHVLSLVVVVNWIGSQVIGLLDPITAISLSGILIATHVWFVTEKTVAHDDARYQRQLESSLWMRMLVRALLTVVFFSATTAMTIFGVAAILQSPYPKGSKWRRALITDVLVAGFAATFIRLATNLP